MPPSRPRGGGGASRAGGPGRGAPEPRREQAEESQGTLHIDGIAAGGDGVGRIDGMVCFTPRTAPGDHVQVAYVPHARLARGRVLQLLDTSGDRVEPRCHHYTVDRCGGCQLQHLASVPQRTARRRIVREALRRIGKREVALPEIVPGPEWEYRGRLTLTLLPRGAGWIGGLHPYDDASRVFALTECPIAHPALVSAWHAMAPLLRGLPKAPSLRIALRLTTGGGSDGALAAGVAVGVEGGASWPLARAWSESLRAQQPRVQSVWWKRADGIVTVLTGDSGGSVAVRTGGAADVHAARGRGSRSELSHVDDLAPSESEALDALAFAQVNRAVAEALQAFVLDEVMKQAPASVVDGYAGTGLLSEALARAGVRVTAIESDPAATARAASRLALFDGARVVTSTMEAGLASALPADVVVLNPPRRGVDERVTRLLAKGTTGVRAIVYVSCDPATLARDLARLPAWRISALRCFDMFPQTAHVETVCVLIPEVP
jgi:23S rRNA (uracil1939-C5)-methyltransferase